jgi:hypothetical protein
MTRIQRARISFIKTIRAAVRLKHSIAADNELDRVLPVKLEAFERFLQRGKLPTPIDIEKLTEGLDVD